VLGTPGDDAIFVGQNGVALNADGDVDVTFAPLPSGLEIRGGGGGGRNSINGQGSQGAGARFQGELVLYGGLTGDEGADSFAGSAGNDTLVAVDGAADVQLSGASGTDTAHFDAGLDPTPVAVEIHLPE
jgi:Ca2+-binding RTX toxin-like protein